MKTLRTAAAIAALMGLPAFAGPTPAPQPFDFDLRYDTDDVLADAQSAQDTARDWREYGERMREWAHEFTTELQGSLALTFSDSLGRGPVVKGAPYSAEAVSESRQTLGDGNVISHENRSRLYRDSEGRTRQETYRKGELRSVYIHDPVAHVSYTLLPRSKVAVVSTSHEPRARHESAPAPEARVERESKVIVDNDGKPGAREEVRIRVVRGDDDGDVAGTPAPPAPPMAPMPPGVWEGTPLAMPFPGEHSLHFRSPPDAAKRTTTRLAARDIEGVKAEGVSTVWTIPAGEIGNRNAIQITRETWTSPDLRLTVLARYNDPRSGESIYRLASIKRAEPSPGLFKLPDGYKVRERHGITPVPAVPMVPPVLPTPQMPMTPLTPPPAPPAPPPPRG